MPLSETTLLDMSDRAVAEGRISSHGGGNAYWLSPDELYLSKGDVDAAWQAADLYRPELEKDLHHPNSKLYPDIAARLVTMAHLYEKGGRSADFASFIAQIRQDYGRRPSLMKALDAKGL